MASNILIQDHSNRIFTMRIVGGVLILQTNLSPILYSQMP